MKRPDELPLPPRRCTPETFYTVYLPELWNHLAGERSWPPFTFELQFDVGDSTPYTLVFAGGSLQGRAGAASSPLVRVTCDGPSWQLAVEDVLPRAIKRLNRRLPDLQPALDRMAHTSASPDDLRTHPGTVRVVFTDDAGDTARVDLTIGDGGDTLGIIEASDDDLWALLDADRGFAQLLKSRALLSGDAAYVIRLVRTLEGGGAPS